MQKKHTNERANFIDLWKIRSNELYKAAKVVWNSELIDHSGGTNDDRLKIHLQYRPAILLMGLSIEVLLKGYIISSRPVLLGEDYPKDLSNHKLVDIYRLAGFYPSQAEIDFLNHLSAAIEWTSKYPVPRKDFSFSRELLICNDGYLITFEEIYGKVLKNFT